MSQPRTMEERVTTLEAELTKLRSQQVPAEPPRDPSTLPVVDVGKRMEGQPMRGEARS